MCDCNFCNLNTDIKKENTIIDESENFYIIPSLGSFIPNYLLFVSKRHIYSMSELNNCEFLEYKKLIRKYIKKYKEKFKRIPIIFEHSSMENNNYSASSIVHAHTHIIDYNFKNEEKLINDLNFKKIKFDDIRKVDKNYIFYLNNKDESYISFDFLNISQLMRLKIAEELGIEKKYDWKLYNFDENIDITIKNFNKRKRK